MREIAAVFARLGLLGFGGPIATMAMMEEEAVRKRGWLNSHHFAEMYALFKMMPGPLATQMAVYLGSLRAGKLGGLLAALLFVGPSFLIVLALSYAYTQSTVLQASPQIFDGLQVGALVVILLSTVQLAKPYAASRRAWVIGLVAGGLIAWRPSLEPLVILAAGLIGAFAGSARARRALGGAMSILTFSGFTIDERMQQLLWTCFKAGAFVFGSGLAIVPMLEGDVVQKYHWLTHGEFMDGLAIGQVTPGPVVITATFIGYKAAGLVGAVAGTIAIFLPCILNVLFILPRIWDRLRKSPRAQAFSSWAIPAVIGCIAGTTLRLGIQTIDTPFLGALFVVTLLICWRFPAPAWATIPLVGAVAALF